MVFTSYVLDNFVAPSLASFDRAEIPDLTADFPTAQCWVDCYFLNSLVRGRFPAPGRQLVLGFLRRSQEAFAAYHRAREQTLAYLAATSEGKQPFAGYYQAIGQWEAFALNYGMAIDVLLKLNSGGKVFEKNDGSRACRLYTIANKVKHLSPHEYGLNGTVTLWLTNDGLNSVCTAVAFSEVADELRGIAGLAEQLKDPKGFIESRKAEALEQGRDERT